MNLREERLLAAFRGLPAPTHVLRPGTLHEMDGLVDGLIEKYKIQEPKIEDTIRDHWGSIIGARFMRQCEPTKIMGKDTLLIKVMNPIVRQELEFIKKQILENLQSVRGCESLTRIAFR